MVQLPTCLLAAICAATGGTLAKYAFSDGSDTLLYKIILIPSSIGFNALGLSMFVEYMHQVGSVKATFLIKAIECVITAIIGYLLFNEILTWKWFIGTALILIGIYVLNKSEHGEQTETESNKKRQ